MNVKLNLARQALTGLAICAAALSGPALAQANSEVPHPVPPAGFHPVSDPHDTEALTVTTTKLPPSTCSALNRVRSGAAPDCQALDYQKETNRQPLPPGTQWSPVTKGSGGRAHAASSYWYWSHSDSICSIYGCWYASLGSWEDGVANGSNVWNWNHGCTPGGYNTSITWCGYFYNGGGWPNYGIQYGMNGNACLFSAYGCFNHGLRRWINDWGTPTGYYTW